MMVAANVEAWLLAIVPIGVVVFLGVLGWVLKNAYNLAVAVGKLQVTAQDHGSRIARLEGWRDGEQFGRAAAEHEQRNGH